MTLFLTTFLTKTNFRLMSDMIVMPPIIPTFHYDKTKN